MMNAVMRRISVFIVLAVCFCVLPHIVGRAHAQDGADAPSPAARMKALPAPAVEGGPGEGDVVAGDAKGNPGGTANGHANGPGLIFLELFTAEMCVFCPTAERHFNDLLSGENVIGVSCVVDYFSTPQAAALARPFCRKQQDIYARMMKTGSIYTPQLVINGMRQRPGHDLSAAMRAIRDMREDNAADETSPRPLHISPGENRESYDVVLPQIRTAQTPDNETFALRVLVIRKTPDAAMLPGGRHKRTQAPRNAAIALIEGGLWDGRRTVWTFTPPQDDAALRDGDAFIVLVQDRDTAHVLAAGQSNLIH